MYRRRFVIMEAAVTAEAKQNEEMFDPWESHFGKVESNFSNDPWSPSENVSGKFKDKIEGQPDFESDRYISRLESKLNRLQGKVTAPTSKEIMKGLSGVREAHMSALVGESNNPYFSVHDYVVDDDDEGTLAALQRRLHPERQALNEEEIKYLVDNDDLEKVREAMQEVDKKEPHTEEENQVPDVSLTDKKEET